MSSVLDKILGLKKELQYTVICTNGKIYVVQAKLVEPLHSIQDILSYLNLSAEDVKSISRTYGDDSEPNQN
ncbi:hypothetical protein LCGC14_2106820 [marine sediment metagenome]|uniref:Uncharacterized protein n=1 Tax=marine sediment metagenome TaxID=412755 RepID=A0A0F9EVM5_9ZZZZ